MKNIREKKLESASDANGSLIRSEERERIRIAHELHDDIGASLAVLAIELLQAGNDGPGSEGKTHPVILGIYEKMQVIAKRVSRLSHQLNSPALEYLGMAQALKTECRVFSEDSGLPVACTCNDVPAKLDPTVGRMLLRVLQEALLNVAKHSGASSVEVKTAVNDGLLILAVHDNGKGFDVEQSRKTPGLGLAGMQARMRFIGGEIQVRSAPGRGTELVCKVPWKHDLRV